MDIPSDEKIVMTDDRYKFFIGSGCKPKCHCCSTSIEIGDFFVISTVSDQLAAKSEKEISDCGWNSFNPFKFNTEHGVMLCGNESCTPQKMFDDASKRRREHLDYVNSRRGCFIKNGRVYV